MTSPWDLLPVKPPSEYDPGPEYFYENVVKPLIPDTIRIMSNGIHMDQEAVEELHKTISEVLTKVKTTLADNPVIQKFQEQIYPKKFKEFEEKTMSSCRDIHFYLKEYSPKNITHRSYFVNTIILVEGIDIPTRTKWTVAEVKKLASYTPTPLLLDIINNTVDPRDNTVQCAMTKLALDKMVIWNKVRSDKCKAVTFRELVPPFNPGSSKQLTEFFDYLKIEPVAFSKDTGNASWNRASVEEVFYRTEEGPLKEALQMFIDYSFSNIISSNFLEAFSSFTVNGALFGNYKLFGAKSFRNTSNSPNMLNAPSTGSIYAKPLKKCFVAPEGYLVASVDYGQLEDRVIANLTKDTSKCDIFLKNLDSHCYNALGYFPKEIAKYMDLGSDTAANAVEFKRLVSEGHKELKAIRQKGKPCTFGISYGSHPPKIAETIKCSLAEATEIFEGYHNVLYPGITAMREDVILPAAKQKGYTHLGLGCRIYSDDISKDSRTIWNACSQFWSILTLIAINRIHEEIDKKGYAEDIKVTSTIYDSIYFIVKEDAKVIKWLNDTLIPIMEVEWVENEIVHNTADLCIGTRWSNVEDTELPHDISEEGIALIIKDLTSTNLN